jgi:hypothetical protein
MSFKLSRSWLKGWVIAILLIAAGLFTIWRFPNYRIASAAADAILIAGVLALTVDYFLKRDLLTEASRGIFVHLLGFEHRPEVKEKLQQLVFDTKLLRKSLDLRCEIEPRGGYNEFTVEYDSEILNPTHNALDYSVQIDVDAAHKLEVLRMSFSSSDGKIAWNVNNPPVKQEEPGVDLVKGKRFSIEPEHKGIIYRASVKYRIRVFPGYSQFYTGVPTLRIRLRVIGVPPEYETSATKATVTNKDDWQYESIMMRGDHITLRWRKRCGEW